MKGIILAAGKGSRLYPLTFGVPKPLLPLYDKPMIYYPLSVLMMAGIRQVLVIVAPTDIEAFRRQLGDGSAFGISIEYAVQETPKGIADAFIIGKDFIGGDDVCLALGDNAFISAELAGYIEKAAAKKNGARVFALPVANPERFGVVEFDDEGRVISIEEKPKQPKSNSIIPGVYFYSGEVVSIAQSLAPSARGELEITDINRKYLERGDIQVVELPSDLLWFDCGTYDSLLEGGCAIAVFQHGHKLLACCPEEIAYRSGWVTAEEIAYRAASMQGTPYGAYLKGLTGR